MLNKRLIALVALVILVVAAAFNVQAATAPASVGPLQVKSDDPALRPPAGEIPLTGAQASDYFERHPEVMHPENAVWHTPPYQGYTPSNAIMADPPNMWHTPPYQGYTPSNAIMADPPGVWHTLPYQGFTP